MRLPDALFAGVNLVEPQAKVNARGLSEIRLDHQTYTSPLWGGRRANASRVGGRPSHTPHPIHLRCAPVAQSPITSGTGSPQEWEVRFQASMKWTRSALPPFRPARSELGAMPRPLIGIDGERAREIPQGVRAGRENGALRARVSANRLWILTAPDNVTLERPENCFSGPYFFRPEIDGATIASSPTKMKTIGKSNSMIVICSSSVGGKIHGMA